MPLKMNSRITVQALIFLVNFCLVEVTWAQPVTTKMERPTGPEFTNSIGMKFRRIEPGEFQMGSPEADLPDQVLAPQKTERVWLPAKGDYDEFPNYRVKISQPFYRYV